MTKRRFRKFHLNILIILVPILCAFAIEQIITFPAVNISLKDLFHIAQTQPTHNKKHIQAAVNWLLTAQKATDDKGISALYSLHKGWAASYPETTGYIIPTFFDYSSIVRNESFKKSLRKSAIELADWEISVQLESGAVQSGTLDISPKPSVFNTGQVLFGWVSAYKKTKDDKYKEAAKKAANWLVKAQSDDGSWIKNISIFTSNKAHTYHARVAWGLLDVYSITSNKIYLTAARKNLDWVLTQQLSNGWFRNNGFYFNDNNIPLTHLIAYTIRSLLESGIYLGNKTYIEAAKSAADVLLKLQRDDDSLSGRYNSEWNPAVKWSCLTGDAQISIIWLRLFEITEDSKYLSAAIKMNDYLKTTQSLYSNKKSIRGGIKGSQPIYGGYMRFSYPNWATKFFIDALILEEKVTKYGAV